ncbi:MerR family transcriptional regulator [Bacillus cabrialesii]|uniref:MerR family transcriptional regulator n=1 Tax=Bacillus cabrialesii TaxID=2487276 RepID=UPI001F02313D|nr:MerR family transcriptional regulator [Bacillus cabrialesii]UQE77813.1 MerR family transcriptional regulator [Bacillus cabrialesii]
MTDFVSSRNYAQKEVVAIPYSIGEFANIIGVTTSTLRYYEKERLLTPHEMKTIYGNLPIMISAGCDFFSI